MQAAPFGASQDALIQVTSQLPTLLATGDQGNSGQGEPWSSDLSSHIRAHAMVICNAHCALSRNHIYHETDQQLGQGPATRLAGVRTLPVVGLSFLGRPDLTCAGIIKKAKPKKLVFFATTPSAFVPSSLIPGSAPSKVEPSQGPDGLQTSLTESDKCTDSQMEYRRAF